MLFLLVVTMAVQMSASSKKHKHLIDKKVLILGATGFIGSHLTKRLKKLKAAVKVTRNIDIRNIKDLKKIIKKEGYDTIFNCIGFSGQINSNKYKIKSFGINYKGVYNILNLVKKFSPKTRVVLLGSRLEYGKALYLPVDEGHPTKPLSAYGKHKLLASRLALYYYKKYKIPTTVFRISNVYGPYLMSSFNGYNVINYFLNQAVQGKNITVFGDGKQIRDYLFIDDLIELFLKTLANDCSIGKIYNIGLGKPITLHQMTSLIALIGKVKIIHKNWPTEYLKTETGDYISDITKIKKETGWKPTTTLKKGIKISLSPLKRFY